MIVALFLTLDPYKYWMNMCNFVWVYHRKKEIPISDTKYAHNVF